MGISYQSILHNEDELRTQLDYILKKNTNKVLWSNAISRGGAKSPLVWLAT